MPPTFRVLRPANFAACRSLLAGLETDRWIFRGQRRSSWKLMTTLERHAERDGVTAIAKEYETLERFFADIILPDSFPREALYAPWNAPRSFDREKFDIVYIFALIQHYFACSRLLDFTEDHRIALFFAIREAKSISMMREEYRTKEEITLLEEFRHEPSCLWCIDDKAVIKYANSVFNHVFLPKMNYPDTQKAIFRETLAGTFGAGIQPESDRQAVAAYWFRVTIGQTLAGMIHGNSAFLADQRFHSGELNIHPLVLSIRLPGIPTLNRRIISQKGLFLAHLNMISTFPHKAQGKITLFESNLGALMAITPDMINDTKVEIYHEGMALEKAEMIKLILPPDMLDELLEYIRDLSESKLELRN